MAKLKGYEYEYLKNKYLLKMLEYKVPFERISHYIDLDVEDEKQRGRMKDEISMEYVKKYEDRMDALLSEVIESLQQPAKWTITKDGEIKHIYPHPVIKNDKVKGIVYKPYRSYLFEDDGLYNRYLVLQNKIEARAKILSRMLPKTIKIKWS